MSLDNFNSIYDFFMWFYENTNGYAFDIDGGYGAQCWDGYANYCIEAGYPYYNCDHSGFVKDIWEYRQTNGILNYCDEVTNLQPGDICFHYENEYTPWSHVSIFYGDAGNGYGYFYGQNQGGPGGAFNLTVLPYWTLYDTAFRFKFKQSDPLNELIEEDFGVRLKVDGIAARRNSPAGEVIRYYNTGDEIEYKYKYVGNGHRYVVWKEGDDFVFMAITPGTDRSSEWVDLFDPNEPVVPDKPESPKNDETSTQNNTNLHGIDISQWNGDMAPEELKKYDFVIIRASFGETEDGWFRANAVKCEALGIPYGVYVYDYAYNVEGGTAEAEKVLEIIKDYDIKCGVWLDQEDPDGFKAKNGLLTREHITAVSKAFLNKVKAAEYYCGVYSTKIWFETYMPDIDCPKWVANWGTNDGTQQSDLSGYAVMHQYTSQPIDKDVMYINLEDMKGTKEAPGNAPETAQEAPKTQDKGNILLRVLRALKDLLEAFKELFRED